MQSKKEQKGIGSLLFVFIGIMYKFSFSTEE